LPQKHELFVRRKNKRDMLASMARRILFFVILLVTVPVLDCTAVAASFGNLVVFGDSLSDIGNIAQAPFLNEPGPYYWNGRFSNGPVYAETLATGLGLATLARSTASGGNDFAYGGAKTTGTSFPDNLFVQDIDDQVGKYLASRTANASTLYAIFAGANDLLDGQTNMSVPVSSLQSSINRLITAGAREFLVFNLPPLGDAPRFNTSQTTLTQFNTRSQQFNSALATMLDSVHASNPTVTVYRFDVTALFDQAFANPHLFDLTNVTGSAAPGLAPGDTSYDTSKIVSNPNQYLFWDDLHPTSAVHLILAHRALDLFFSPGDYSRNAASDAADYVLWRKGMEKTYVPIDYDIWRAHFGQLTVGAAALEGADVSVTASVPEPATLLQIILLSTVLFSFRGRGGKKVPSTH
jgi:phospholipase/lecithinase/hemolysin